MRLIMELVQIRLDDPTSIINRLDDKKKSINKQLHRHISNCEQALKDVEPVLKKYNRMSIVDRLVWALFETRQSTRANGKPILLWQTVGQLRKCLSAAGD